MTFEDLLITPLPNGRDKIALRGALFEGRLRRPLVFFKNDSASKNEQKKQKMGPRGFELATVRTTVASSTTGPSGHGTRVSAKLYTCLNMRYNSLVSNGMNMFSNDEYYGGSSRSSYCANANGIYGEHAILYGQGEYFFNFEL